MKKNRWERYEKLLKAEGMEDKWNYRQTFSLPGPGAQHHSPKYYELAQRVLWEHNFNSERQRQIWELHAAGKSLREIGRALVIGPATAQREIKKTLAELESSSSGTPKSNSSDRTSSPQIKTKAS